MELKEKSTLSSFFTMEKSSNSVQEIVDDLPNKYLKISKYVSQMGLNHYEMMNVQSNKNITIDLVWLLENDHCGYTSLSVNMDE